MNFKDFFSRISDFVGRMTPSQVMMLFGIIAGSVVGIVLVVGWVSSVTYGTLYSNLEDGEAGEVTAWLSDNKIPYKLTDNGTTIQVPSEEVYKTRISLAAEGLPKAGNMGYSLFDKNNLGMTDFLQNLNFRRALEGELTRTIQQINGVQAARVHIVIPKDRLFREDKKETTASVLLKLKGRSGLDRSQINGITHLVASSVEGLKSNNITIVDYDGNLLSGGQQQDPLAGMSSSQLDVRQSVEKYLEDKAQTMLDGVLGAGKSIVRVTADLNFQQLEKTSETFDPNSATIRSEERTKTSSVAIDKSQETNTSNNDENSETTVTNYEINKTVEHIVNAIGTVNRLTVALMVDGSYTTEAVEGGEPARVYQPRSQEELDRLAAVVRSAVGFDQQRNDQLEIFNVSFDREELQIEQEQLDTMYERQFYWDIGQKVGLVLLILLALFYVKRVAKKLFSSMGRLLPAQAPPQVVRPSAIEDEDMSPMVMEKRKPKLVDYMQQTAKERPEEVAKVIKTMMIE